MLAPEDSQERAVRRQAGIRIAPCGSPRSTSGAGGESITRLTRSPAAGTCFRSGPSQPPDRRLKRPAAPSIRVDTMVSTLEPLAGHQRTVVLARVDARLIAVLTALPIASGSAHRAASEAEEAGESAGLGPAHDDLAAFVRRSRERPYGRYAAPDAPIARNWYNCEGSAWQPPVAQAWRPATRPPLSPQSSVLLQEAVRGSIPRG